MAKYLVTIMRGGCMYVEADSPEDAIDIANHQTTDSVFWDDDWEATDCQEDDSYQSEYITEKAFEYYSEFDAELVIRFLLSPAALLELKKMPVYTEMKEAFKFAKNEFITDVYNDLFNNFEERIPCTLCDTLKREHNYVLDRVSRREVMDKLLEMYSFEISHAYIQVATSDGEFENNKIRIIMERVSEAYLYSLAIKGEKNE